MNTRLVIIAIMVLFVILGFAYAMRMIKIFEEKTKRNKVQKGDISSILYEKTETWGPCPPNEICTRTITIENSGEVKIMEEETHDELLPEDIHAELVQTIKDTRIMSKKCKPGEITDYSATITINLDGESKEIDFPGCESELEEIEDVIGQYIHL